MIYVSVKHLLLVDLKWSLITQTSGFTWFYEYAINQSGRM